MPMSEAGTPLDANRLFPNSKLVKLDRISVEVVGSGPDLILIPGLASSRATFSALAARLRGHYRLHLIQVAGFAGEPARANASGPVIGPTEDAIRSYMSEARLVRPMVIGHSLGGLMALELAADHPDLFSKLMIVDTLAFYTQVFAGPHATAAATKPIADAIGAQMLGQSDADFAAASAKTVTMMVTAPDDQARIQAWTVSSARPTLVKAMQEDMLLDLRPRMANITAPVTVLYEAPLDALIQADYAPVAHKTLIATKPGVKHFIMYDDPKAFDAAVDGFLTS